MDFEPTKITDVMVIKPKVFCDDRGYFMETFRQIFFAENISPVNFLQDNQSLSKDIGTVRGLHFQLSPKAQGKLVRCVAGAIFDDAVDLRSDSPTFGEHVAVELTAENGCQLWVPPGFAHGFCTLVHDTVVSYKVTQYYSARHDRGLLWNDPALNIDWPVSAEKAFLSNKDRSQPKLAEIAPTADWH